MARGSRGARRGWGVGLSGGRAVGAAVLWAALLACGGWPQSPRTQGLERVRSLLTMYGYQSAHARGASHPDELGTRTHDRVCAGDVHGAIRFAPALYVWEGDQLVELHRPPRGKGWPDLARESFSPVPCTDTDLGFACDDGVTHYSANLAAGTDVLATRPPRFERALVGHPGWLGPVGQCWPLPAPTDDPSYVTHQLLPR